MCNSLQRSFVQEISMPVRCLLVSCSFWRGLSLFKRWNTRMVIKKSFYNPLFQRFKVYLNLSNIKVYRYWKIKPQWWNTTKIQDLWDRTGQRHKYTHRGSDSTHKTCISSSQTKSTLNGRGGQPASPWADQILTVNRSWEPGNQVFKSTVPDKVTILHWKATHPKLYSQHKLNS